MLFSHIAHRNWISIAICDGRAKHLFAQKNSLSVMPKRSVTKVGEECFLFIEPLVNRKIVLGLATEFPGAALRVLHWMSNGH